MTHHASQSVVHRLHPAVKLAWLLWVTVAVFTFESATLPWVAVCSGVGLYWACGTAPWRIPGLRMWLTLGAGILLTHAIIIRVGVSVVGPFTDAGLMSGCRAAGRLLAVILMSAVFVTTTEPFSLACALMRAGLPYRWGFALVTALRLAPVFRLEAHHVYRAQLIRGVAYGMRGVRRWWVVLRHLCLPMVVSALRTAHSLSLSMEGRAFGLYPTRTYTREMPLGGMDYAAIAMLAATLAFAMWRVVVA